MALTLFFVPNKDSVFQTQAGGVFFRFFGRFEDEIFLWLFLDYMPYFITKTDFIQFYKPQKFKGWTALSVDNSIGFASFYPLDGSIHLLNNWGLIFNTQKYILLKI